MAGSREPQDLGRHDWYYEEKTHLLLVHEVYKDGEYVRTDQVKIPWRKIKRSIDRVFQ